ncbi:hypothetical protein [Bacteroides acidifaciens]|nr:hypothetical protein [Bacteroides acidifaciens]
MKTKSHSLPYKNELNRTKMLESAVTEIDISDTVVLKQIPQIGKLK